MKRYDDAIVVVTGASSGIGRRLAIDFAHRGGTVVGVARRESLLQELRDELRRSRDANDTVVCDVGNTDAFTEMLDGVMTRFGRIDVLVNNAGIEQPTPVVGAAMDLRPYRHMLDVNFLGAVAGTLAVVPGMLARGSGVIANVSSDVVRAPEPRESAYAATKAALSAFTESVAHEVASKGVHVHVIYPGMGADGDGHVGHRTWGSAAAQAGAAHRDRGIRAGAGPSGWSAHRDQCRVAATPCANQPCDFAEDLSTRDTPGHCARKHPVTRSQPFLHGTYMP